MQKTLALLIAAALLVPCSSGVETLTWRQSDYADFEKGSLKNLSIRSDGRLTLAPVFKEILETSSAYLWTLAEDSKGNLYAGGGGPGGNGASVYVIPPNGPGRLLAEIEGFEVHAIAVDAKDRIYAATSPDGKIYRITPDGKAEVFYEPAAKYIWAMAFNSKSDLFVATGDEGIIYRVTPDGKGSVFFRTEEAHARALAVDAKGNLIVGTEPGGLVLRVSPSGDGFVLYQASRREITSVAAGPDGSIYAAGVGAKQPLPAPPPTAPPAPSPPKPSASPVPTLAPQPQTRQQAQTVPPPSLAPTPTLVTGGSEIYRIDPDGYPQRVWDHPQDIVYAIGFDAEGRPVVGAGNRGAVYRLDSDLLFTLLLTAPPTQVTCLYGGRQGKLYAATGNIGKVYQIGPESAKEGSMESEVFDASLFSLWGRLSFRGEASGGSIRFETRSGNLDRPHNGWSSWTAVPGAGGEGRIQSPRARFLQWKLALAASPAGRSPEVRWVEVAYLPRNVAPVVEQIEITPPNYRFPPQSLTLTPSQTITLQPLSQNRKKAAPSPVASSSAVSMQYEKGHIGARWAAKDDNNDTLSYKVEIKGAQESEWKLLKDGIKDRQLSWDSTAFPDGEYLLRVTASDAPDNPPQQALAAELVSERFLIDNTPPEISGLAASPAGGKLNVTWKARDAHSPIRKAEYSVNGGEWIVVEPTTRISDSREHDYNLALERISQGEHTIAVRVTDEFDNQSVAKVVVR